MLDKVVLCKEGQEIYTGLKNHTYSLQESSVQVYLVSGSISESDLSTVTWSTLDGLSKVLLVSKHSMLTELHVVAYGAVGGTTKGHYIALVIGGVTCLAIAYSQEEMTGNEKLFLTFDFEETKGVLTAKADFDGNITQGILDEILSTVAKSGSYEDLSNKPTIPSAANNSTITVYAGGDVSGNSISGGTELGSFTVDQSSNGFVNLGAAAAKAVDTSISASVSSSNLPTTDAVKGYVKDSTFSFNASVYTQEELESKRHNYELVPCGSTVLCLDHKLAGIGSKSCGPDLSEKYRVCSDTFRFSFVLKPEVI
jgi:beta-galactosidase